MASVFFFIIGFGKTTAEYLRSAGTRVCPRCGNRAEWSTYRIKTWFTLFFVPVFPYKTATADVCPVCRYGSDGVTDLPGPPASLRPGPPAWGPR